MLTFEQALTIVKGRDKAWWEANGHTVARGPDGRFARSASAAVAAAPKPKGPRKPRAPKASTPPRPEPRRGADALSAVPKTLESFRYGGPTRGALDDYRAMGYQDINERLRTPEVERPNTKDTDRSIELIDKAMARSALMADVEVQRGIVDIESVFGARAGRSLKGAEWTEHAYVSTTADEKVGDWFTGDDEVKMRIRVPAGTQGIEISPFSDGQGSEAELLLQRGLRMRVTGDTGPVERGSVRWLDVEVVPA